LPGVDLSIKAESLLVLEERTLQYRVVDFFDGEENGKPMAFIVHN